MVTRARFPVPPLPRTEWGRGDREPYAHLNARLAMISDEAPRTPWNEFQQELKWLPGEHFACIGPTGLGKTTMMKNLLPLHPFVTVFATKPRDATMDELVAKGYHKMQRWVSLPAHDVPRRVLWPDASQINSEERQREVFHEAFAKIYREGNWTIGIDELWYIINKLNLGSDVKTMLLQARSLGISLLACTQRPAWVPVELYDQSTHLMFWRESDERNLRRISGISWRSSSIIQSIIADLDLFQVLYINTRTGRMLRTRCPRV